MNIGLIGPGEIGAVIVRKLRDAGYPVKMANSKGPDLLRKLAVETGAKPVSVEEVVRDVDVLFIAIPEKAIPELPKGLLNKAQKETIVIDVGNYYPFRDGLIDGIENGLTDSEWVEKQIGRPVIKALNSIVSNSLEEAGRPPGSRDRVALPISGDNPRAKETVAKLIDRMGFDSVDAGTIAESWRQQPGSPVYCTNLTKEELQKWLKNVDRSSLVIKREEGMKAHFAVERWFSAIEDPIIRIASENCRSCWAVVAPPRPNEVPRPGTVELCHIRAWLLTHTIPNPPVKSFLIR